MTPKELFRQPNTKLIENNRCRTRPTQCPVCREIFYSYEKLDEFENRISDEPYIQPMNSLDRHQYLPSRQTCGAWECYMAEERYCHSKSPFFHRDRLEQKEPIKRPKGITTLGELM